MRQRLSEAAGAEAAESRLRQVGGWRSRLDRWHRPRLGHRRPVEPGVPMPRLKSPPPGPDGVLPTGRFWGTVAQTH